MTETKHTPGPWAIDPNADYPLAVIVFNDESDIDGLGICEVTSGNRADAALIAAAPETAAELAQYKAAYQRNLDEARAIAEAHVRELEAVKVQRDALLAALVNLLEVVDWLGDSGNLKSPIEPHPFGLGVMLAKQDARNAIRAARGEG